jgi:hypothetical protein
MQVLYDVNITLLHLEKYIRFINLQGRPQPASKVQGYIVLHVNTCKSWECNIYSALMLVRSLPHLRIRWYESWLASNAITLDEQGVAEIILSPQFLEYVATSATEVWIVPHAQNVELQEGDHQSTPTWIDNVDIQLKPEIEKGLMRSDDAETWVDSEALLVWLQDLGASEDHSHCLWPRLQPSLSACGFISDWSEEFPEPDFSNLSVPGF